MEDRIDYVARIEGPTQAYHMPEYNITWPIKPDAETVGCDRCDALEDEIDRLREALKAAIDFRGNDHDTPHMQTESMLRKVIAALIEEDDD